ncbi:penicillin-binding protein 2 [candidate division TA06 bacterium]|uniref:Penicillin-binding protein 2 n=1 Tax=candidate division TA06 bacterium TaxID=2250710 RepID=A0A933I9W7_UNCT6|nr:penicillin-binding protein 2 [candidate division TA06 bacterium]
MMSHRTKTLAVFCFFIWALMAGRLVWLQAFKGGYYRSLALRQHRLRIGILPERGRIVDRQGRPLALSIDGRRSYPYGAVGGQMLGFLGKDGRGLEGLELYYDRELSGEAGWDTRQCDARGRVRPSLEYASKPARSGNCLQLTIDAEYQAIADEELKKAGDKFKAAWGAAVIADPATGEILGMASYPEFDPNHPELFNRQAMTFGAVAAQFEPGSTFKAVTIALGLKSKTIDTADVFDGEQGSYAVGGHRIGEAESHNKYGPITVSQALAFSSNVCLAKIGLALGKDKLYQGARAFGFGSRTGIECPGEAPGLLDKPDGWPVIKQANISFGQGLAVSALQLVMAYGAIANGGYLLRPRLIKGLAPSGQLVDEACRPDTLRRVISDQTSAKVIAMLERCVSEGTGQAAQIEGWRVAGKTGTAQKKEQGKKGYASDKYVASFIGFVPAEAPRLLVAVIIDEPKGRFFGNEVAAPVCRNVMQRIISLPKGLRQDLLAAR